MRFLMCGYGEGTKKDIGGVKNMKDEELKERKGETIEKEVNFVLSGGMFEHCTFISHVPKQMCFKCKSMFEIYLVDDEIWNKLPETLRGKYICPLCLKNNIGGGK